jgi:hypothetical protein
MKSIAKVPAGTGIHGADHHKISRKSEAAVGAGDGYYLIFKRLAKDFQHSSTELRKLIQEQNPMMTQAYLSGLGPVPTPNQTGV